MNGKKISAPASSCIHLTALLLPALVLTACGTKFATPRSVGQEPPIRVIEPPAPVTPAAPVRPTIEPTATIPPPEPLQSLPAAINLRNEATRASDASDHLRAIGLLERALRISPNDPQIFYDLANNHLAMKRPEQALQLARRGLSLNPTNTQRDSLEQLAARSEAML